MGRAALVGHTSRSLLTVEAYLARPAAAVEDVAAAPARQALHLVTDLAVDAGLAGPLLLAATGRRVAGPGFSVL